jgi:hypothetical protein
LQNYRTPGTEAPVSTGAFKFRRASLVAMIVCTAAGCGDAASPASPSAPPALQLAGVVKEASADIALPHARVEVIDGVNQGRSGVADAEGRYTLADLQPGTFTLRAGADGFEPDQRSVTLTSAQTIDFALRRAGKDPAARWNLAGIVRDAASQLAVAGTRLDIIEGANQGRATVADADGRYSFVSLDAGSLTVRASADGFGPELRTIVLNANAAADFVLTRTGPPPPKITGRAVDAISSQALAGVTVRIDGLGETTTAADGVFGLTATAGEEVHEVTLNSPQTIERRTRVRVSGPDATLTLIPTAIDLAAFDQMFRADRGVLRRWVSAPRVVVQRRVLQFTGTGDSEYPATAALMTDAEAAELVADLSWALPQLTGNTFDRFVEQRIETAAEGQLVSVTRPEVIVVARYEGLATATSFWGYTRWAWNSSGEVVAAVLMLDRQFDVIPAGRRRSLRAHELGHALGYNHVQARESVMNASGSVSPTLFDRDGSRIAFLRKPLNQSPDTDPDSITVNQVPSGRLFWSGAP